jgi:hypothetical protein
MSWAYWDWNPTSGDTGGILNSDWTTVDQAKISAIVPGLYQAPPTARFAYTDEMNQTSGGDPGEAYSGPVANLHYQYLWGSADRTAIRAEVPNVFLKGGPGDDALAVTSGINVLDGGQGSNFLVGGDGRNGGFDTFFVDGRGGGTTWSTVVNFHPGDQATIFGFVGGVSTMAITASDGVTGYQGVTIHSELAGAGTGVNASFTFANIGASTLASHFAIGSDVLPGNIPYLLITYQ